MPKWGLLLLIACAGACGGGDDGNVTPIDAPTVDAAGFADCSCPSDAAVDAATAIDAPSACAMPPVFINGGGGTYTAGGADNSTTNVSVLLTGTRTIGGPGATRATAIADVVRTALAAQGVQVTTTDPGATAHLEIVLASSGWPFAGSPAATAFTCQVIPRGVGWVDVTGLTDAQAAAYALFDIGGLVGLELSTTANNCRNQAGAGCTFSTTATVGDQCAMGTTQDQLAAIAAALGCP